MAVSSSASQSVRADVCEGEEVVEDVEEERVDNCEEDLREIITRGKTFLLLQPEPVVATLPAAKYS